MRYFLSGMRTQFWLVRRQPDDLLTLCTIPFTVVILLSVVVHAGKPELVANALLAPALIGLWEFAVVIATDAMESERWNGTIDLGMAAPGKLHWAYSGRMVAMIGLGVIPLGESWLVGWAFFDVVPTVHHPVLFAAAMAVSVFAMSGTALVLAAAMLATRNSGVYNNFLSFPVYILSGVVVPISHLPNFLEPLSHAVFLFWSADLLRDCLRPDAVDDAGLRLFVIGGLGALALLVGRLALRAVLRRAREIGTLTYA